MTEGSDSARAAAWWQVWRWKFHWQVLTSVVIGAVIGLGWAKVSVANGWHEGNDAAATIGASVFSVVRLLGDLFLSALKMIVVPLVVTSLALSVAGLGGRRGFGRLTAVTLTFFLTSSLIAVLVGLLLVNSIGPGKSSGPEPLLNAQEVAKLAGELSAEANAVAGKAGTAAGTDLLHVFRSLIPANPIQAAAETNLLGLITIAILIGLFIPRIEARLGTLLTDFLQAIHDLTMAITHAILSTAPIGVGCLMASTLAEQGTKLLDSNRGETLLQLLSALGLFAVTTLVALVIHQFLILPLSLMIFGGIDPRRHYRAMMPAMLTAFSTSSSNATLPVTLECIENEVGVSKRTSSFVLPLGATVNMDGTALYECTAAMFVVQLFGIDLTFAEQVLVVMTALLTSVGVAGVPSASLVAIIIILQALENQLTARGITAPLMSGLALILVFDRVLDMARTVVNITSDSCAAVIAARWMGETDLFSKRVK